MVTASMNKVNLNTSAARDIKVGFLAAAVAGDDLALLVYADWLEEMGHGERAARWRREVARYQRYDSEGAGPMGGGTWVRWVALYELSRMAASLIQECTAFGRLMYSGNYSPWGEFAKDDGSIDYAAAAHGYIPTFRRGNRSQASLGRIVEAAGFEVFWIE